MLEQKANNLVRGERVTPAVHPANAVGIAIGDQTKIYRLAPKRLRGGRVVARDGLGVDATKVRIMRAIEGGDFAIGALQQFLEAPCPNSKQRLVPKTQTAFGDEFEIYQLPQGPIIARANILHTN